MRHIKIALTGKMRSGKDTVYELMRDEVVSRLITQNSQEKYILVSSKQFAFGDELKRFAHMLFPERFVDGKKDRELYQKFGQMMREINPDIWVNKVEQSIRQQLLSEQSDVYVSFITDLRQPNEYNYCKEHDFYVVRVHADDESRLARMVATGDNFAEEHLKHDTESHVDSYVVDYHIDNSYSGTGSLGIVREKIRGIIDDIIHKQGEDL